MVEVNWGKEGTEQVDYKENVEEKTTLLTVNTELPSVMLIRTRSVRETVRKNCCPDVLSAGIAFTENSTTATA